MLLIEQRKSLPSARMYINLTENCWFRHRFLLINKFCSGAPHTNGIIIAWQDITGNGCYSALGRAPGFNGRSPFTITELGAPSGWQLMSYGDMATSSCSGLDEGIECSNFS